MISRRALVQFRTDLKQRSLAMHSKKRSLLIILGFFVLALSGCTQGDMVKIPVTMPHGERLTIVDHDQKVTDWLVGTSKLALNYVVYKDVTTDQIAAVTAVETACRTHTKNVRPNDLVSVGFNSLLSASTGWIAGGLASKAFPNRQFSSYAQYTSATEGFGVAASGIVSLSSKVYTFENCSETIFSMDPQYEIRLLRKVAN